VSDKVPLEALASEALAEGQSWVLISTQLTSLPFCRHLVELFKYF